MENPDPLLSKNLLDFLKTNADKMTPAEFMAMFETFLNGATMIEILFEQHYPAEYAEWNKALLPKETS